MSFTIEPTSFEGVSLIQFDTYDDRRGSFSELYQASTFRENGIDTIFVQDNISTSKKGVLRGLHFQKYYPQAKLVLPLSGKIYDVFVDLREDSLTYGKAEGYILEKSMGIFVPRGFAHGFLSLAEETTVLYKCDNLYDPNDESGILWNDSNLAIDWQKIMDDNSIIAPILSVKDGNLPTLSRQKTYEIHG